MTVWQCDALDQLRKILAQRQGETTNTREAKELGISRAQLCHILYGRRKPTLEQAIRLSARYGIAVEGWSYSPADDPPLEPPAEGLPEPKIKIEQPEPAEPPIPPWKSNANMPW